MDGQLAIDQGVYSGVNHLGIGATGQLDGGSGVLSLSGDFANAGTGEVRSVDGCGATRSTFTGANTFSRLWVSTTTGRVLVLPSGFTQTVQAALTLNGAPGNLLPVRSTTPGTAASLNLLPGATQAIAHVDVADNRATGQVIDPGTLASFNPVMRSNVSNWFVTAVGPGGGAVTPVPTLGLWGMGLLGLLTALAAARPLRRRRA